MPGYIKVFLQDDGLVILYYSRKMLSHVITGENIKTGQPYYEEFTNVDDASRAFEGLPGLMQEYETADQLEAMLSFLSKNYVLEIQTSLRGLIRRLRRRFGIASREDRLWMMTWGNLQGAGEV